MLPINEDKKVIIDGAHRFVAIMIWKNITPSNYKEKIKASIMSEEKFQITNIPSVITAMNLNHIVTTLNIGAEATLKENLYDKLNGYRRIILLNLRNNKKLQTQLHWPKELDEVKKYLGLEKTKDKILDRAVRILHSLCQKFLWKDFSDIVSTLITLKIEDNSFLRVASPTSKRKPGTLNKLGVFHIPSSIYSSDNVALIKLFLHNLIRDENLVSTKKVRALSYAYYLRLKWNDFIKDKKILPVYTTIPFELLDIDMWNKYVNANRSKEDKFERNISDAFKLTSQETLNFLLESATVVDNKFKFKREEMDGIVFVLKTFHLFIII